MWNFFISNSRFTYLLILVLIGFGLFSISSIPKESAPEVQVPVGIITTVLPSAPAIDVESLVTNELERGLSGSLENVKKITSTSKEGVSSITVEFLAEADIDKSISDLKDKVETLVNKLPDDAERPIVTEVNFVDQPIMTIAVSGDKTEEELSFLADDLVDELETVKGISRVEKSGVRDREVTVLVDQASLLRFNLTINDVLSAIRSANNTFPVGQIVTDNVSYNIIFDGGVDTADSIKRVPVAVRGGQPVFVQDVAEVVIGLAPVKSYSRLSVEGEPSQTSLTLSVYKQRGGDITLMTESIQNKLDELNKNMLSGMSTYVVYDAGADIKHDLHNLTVSGLQTVLLVIGILMIAIGWREGLIAGLSIPLTFTIGFIGLYFSDNTLNFISLFALILGIGVLVDSGIVVVEDINKRIQKNPTLSKIEAAKQTINEFSAPLISGTLTTVAMFVGLFVVGGVTGQFISSIPFTLIFILLASLIVALGFLPLITAKLLKQNQNQTSQDLQNRLSQKIENWYRSILTRVMNSVTLQKRFLILITLGFITSIALIPLGLVKVVFFAQSDVDDVFVEVELSEGSIKESTDLAVRKVEEELYKHNDVIEAFSTTIGAGSAFGSNGANSRFANIQVSLKEDRNITSSEFVEILRSELSDIRDVKVTVSQPSDGPPTGSPVGIKLFGDDIKVLTQTANEISQKLSTINGTTNIKTDADTNTTEIEFIVDEEKAALYGFNPQIISQTLRSAVYGTEATSITSPNDDVAVMVRLNLSDKQQTDPEFANWTTVNTLQNIELSTPNGDRIALASLSDIGLREASSVIKHEDQKRVMNVGADVTKDGNVIEISNELKKEIDENMSLPAGVTYSMGGETEDSNQAFIEMFYALLIGMVLMIAILVFQFDSYRHTFYVLSILPFSLIGILYGLAITGSSLSFPSIMGFIALSGIIVNNSILLIDMMNKMRLVDPDKSITEVVIDSSVSRLRPIVLTSASTVMGMIPLLYSDEIWIPLATAVIFGLIFSVIITLLLVPIIYGKWPGQVNSKF
jgi:multidrug efflux pump subunit AcrB